MQTRTLFHGANGDNILGILNTAQIVPSAQGEVFFSEHRWDSVLMHGADQRRRAAFACKVEITVPNDATLVRKATPGVADTLVLQTRQPVRARVLELFVRKPGEDGFTLEEVRGEVEIRAYLMKR
jgi:hypothetical protein